MFCSYTLYVHVWILAFLIAELVICQARLEGGWNSAPNTQYHIQTDEGDERYFRYQTLTGQYRKEKRLQDGSVVGTYGWVDADGWLRLKDYVADEQGYRIVRSKKLYVGASTPIDSASQPSKYVPSHLAVPANPYKPVYDSYVPIVDNSLSSTAAPYAHDYQSPITVSSTAAPYNSHDYYAQTVSSTAAPYNSHDYHAQTVSSTAAPYNSHDYHAQTVSSTAAPYNSHDYHAQTVSSTAAPYNSHDYHAQTLSSTAAPYNSHNYHAQTVSSTAAPYNSHEYNHAQIVSSSAAPHSPNLYHASSTSAPYAVSSTPTYAVSSTESPYTQSSTASPYAVSSKQSPYATASTPTLYSASSTASPYSSNDYDASPVTDNSIASSTASPYKSDVYDDYLNSKSFVSQTEKPLEFPSSNLGPISLADYLKSAASETHVQREVAITPHYRFAVSTTPTPPSPVYERSTEAPRPVTFRPYYNRNVVSSGFQYGDRRAHKDAEYDGVSLTHDGFKYYLPKQYHEEEGSSSSHRAGSFGYVDPFGIRRVIYYNTSPEKGFVHRKNNRYVGFDAPPYDPRF